VLKDCQVNQETTADTKQTDQNINEKTLSWYQVPEEIKELLILAAQNWENTAESEKYIHQALAKNDSISGSLGLDNTDVMVAAYRYFFYKNNSLLALQMAVKVVEKIKYSEKLPDDWEQLKPILVSRKEEPKIRLYLNAYAASGLVLAKLGEIEQAKEITSRVKEIDDKKEFGASTIFDILTRPPEEDE
jgi:tetratricopeptide (TPR) repeat protein